MGTTTSVWPINSTMGLVLAQGKHVVMLAGDRGHAFVEGGDSVCWILLKTSAEKFHGSTQRHAAIDGELVEIRLSADDGHGVHALGVRDGGNGGRLNVHHSCIVLTVAPSRLDGRIERVEEGCKDSVLVVHIGSKDAVEKLFNILLIRTLPVVKPYAF